MPILYRLEPVPKLLLILVPLLLLACTTKEDVRLGPQVWNGVSFIVESRPSPIRQGMNEFIVIASKDNVRPGVDLVISMRTNDQDKWRQAIQDGFSGVYRRAVLVRDPQNDVLQVHIRQSKAKEETVLHFPLAPAAPGS
jgi:hypothetical protein